MKNMIALGLQWRYGIVLAGFTLIGCILLVHNFTVAIFAV